MQRFFLISLLQNRELLQTMSWKEINGRYRGSLLGRSWSLINPIIMLVVYTFIFSTVFKARWQDLEELGPLGFAVNIFSGLIVFGLFAECISVAPNKILENPNFVKRVVFPLEILSATTLISAIFHALTSLVALAAFELFALGRVPLTFILIPVTWIPLCLICLGSGWLLSAAGVFFRDTAQLITPLVNMLMFLSAVFYPVSALPKQWQLPLQLNPVAVTIEQTRIVAIQSEFPSARFIVLGTIIGAIFAQLSFNIFQKVKRGFADVI